MSTVSLFGMLKNFETELHRVETRRNVSRLDELLHPSFEEYGRSGFVFSRNDIFAEFSDISDYQEVVAMDFNLHEIGADAALLTYTSAHMSEAGELHRFTLRSSLWVRESGVWRLRFHQGTPTECPADGAK